jgi:tetratricopeptide (TPR) repeat protein
VVTFTVILVLNPRVYYLWPAFPILQAGGSVLWESWLESPRLRWAKFESEHYPEVQTLCSDATRGTSNVIMLHEDCFLLAFVQNDSAAMQRQLQWSHGNPAEGELIDEAAWAAMYRGKIAEARSLFSRARQISLKNDFVELAAQVDLDEAGLDADLGYALEAKERALDALKLAPDSAHMQASAALALAPSGDVTRAQSEAEKAASQAPSTRFQISDRLMLYQCRPPCRQSRRKCSPRLFEIPSNPLFLLQLPRNTTGNCGVPAPEDRFSSPFSTPFPAHPAAPKCE